MSFQPCDGPGIPPGFDKDKTWQRVHVRNTFIEVDEEHEHHADLSFLDLHNAPGRTWRRGHLRCASEPMSFFLSQPPWEPLGLTTPPFLPSGSLNGTLPNDSRAVGSERGRTCPHSVPHSVPHGRSLNPMTMTIREEEYDSRESLRQPQYIGMKSPEVSPGAEATRSSVESTWCGEPMLVDVRSTSPGFEDEGLASSPEWSGPPVPTLALPVQARFRHARQRSRTIQEDSELSQNLDELTPDKVHQLDTLAWNSLGEAVNGVNVRVRNTFIEVDEGSDGCTDPSVLSARPAWRPGHLRCASEPIPSYPTESRISGFHSRSSSYQEEQDVTEILQAQLGLESDHPLGPSSDVFPFVHGSATCNDAPPNPEYTEYTVSSDPAERHLRALSPTSTPPSLAGSFPPKASCKWHNRGTCKYGDACRFSHATVAKPSKAKANSSETRPGGPLPAGLVPGGSAPFPVGVVSPEADDMSCQRETLVQHLHSSRLIKLQ
eukprot:Skav224560  [mRNA]  locus=scaffold2085:116982:118743:+ [translate_table: standard]